MTITPPDYAGAMAYAIERLRTEISPLMTYHNVRHAEQDILPAVQRLARLTDHIGDEDYQLLEVAAIYHDIGFVEQMQDHEMIGARIVAQTLPGFGFAARQIESIMGMLLATRMPQSPRNVLEQILADADLDVLGRADFFECNLALQTELSNLGRPFTDIEWYQSQLAFMEQHVYFTEAARHLRDAGKQANIAEMRARLRAAASAINDHAAMSSDQR